MWRPIRSEAANPRGVNKRSGSNIGCRGREVVIDMGDAVPNQALPPQRVPSRRRRVVDQILIAFHFACDEDNLEVADQRKRCGGDIWRRGVWLCC